MTTKQSRTEMARSFITVKNVSMNFHTHIQMKAEKEKSKHQRKKSCHIQSDTGKKTQI